MLGSADAQNGGNTTRSVLAGNRVPMWICDRRTRRFLDVSAGALAAYGYTRDEFLALGEDQISPRVEMRTKQIHPTVSPANRAPANDSTPPQLPPGRIALHRRKDGSSFPVRLQSNALLYNGRAARLVVVQVVPSSMESSSSVPGTAHLEWTIGLPDRLRFEQRALEAIEQADRSRRRVAVVCLDLDRFEEVRRRFGPEGCDACMDQIAGWLTRRVRGMDTVARTGAHAFTVVLAELDDNFDLYRVAEALLKVFGEPVTVEDQPVTLSASIGIAVYPDDGRDLGRLRQASDTAMQQARASGGHRIAMFSLESRERTELAAFMREALKKMEFELHYQPQQTAAGEICKLEALLRLPNRHGEFIPPDLFIPIAEETGMIEQLGMWVIEQACCQAKLWQQQFGGEVGIAVNVSPLQLRSLDFADNALAMIHHCGVDPRLIEFEITERAVLNFDEVVEPMRQLAQAGIVFAVDDFGTGYSSLQHLHRLPISVLKIDRSFVQRMGVSRGSDAIVEAIVSMAHTLGMTVVAEGVETQAQRDAATKVGCDVIQGFLHSPAVEPSRIPELMGWTH